jgi:hypothetical protein
MGLLGGLVLLLGGSCAHVRLREGYAGPRELPAVLSAYYSYPPRPIEATIQTRKQEKRYDILRIEFPSALNLFGTEIVMITTCGKARSDVDGPDAADPAHRFCGQSRLFTLHGINCAVVHNRR